MVVLQNAYGANAKIITRGAVDVDRPAERGDAVNVGDYGTLGQAVYASTTVKAQLDTLTAQVATGHVADSYAGLGRRGADLARPAAADRASRGPAIRDRRRDRAVGRHPDRADADHQHRQHLQRAAGEPEQCHADADRQRGGRRPLGVAAGRALLDTTDGGNYVFAGTDTRTRPCPTRTRSPPPVLSPRSAPRSPGWHERGGATAASTLAIASSDAAGTTPFSGPPGRRRRCSWGRAAPVQVGVLANANTLAVSAGTSTTGSYMRDILRGLATLANLSSSQANDAGFVGLVQDTRTSLSGAITRDRQRGGGARQHPDVAERRAGAGGGHQHRTDGPGLLRRGRGHGQDGRHLSQVQTQLSASYKLIRRSAACPWWIISDRFTSV